MAQLGSSNVYGDLSITGSCSAASFNATSAREKKENISDAVLNACKLLNSVNVVNFNFKDDKNKVPKIGFIADDTDSLLSTPDHDQMDITNCIGILIKAVQELSKELEVLKSTNRAKE